MKLPYYFQSKQLQTR